MSADSHAVRRVVTTVFIGMVASIGVYALLLAFGPRNAPGPPGRPGVSAEGTLLAIGAGEYLLATLFGRRMLASSGREALERVRSYFLVRFAAAEAIGIFGLVLFFLGAPAGHAAVFFAASIAALLFAYPSREAFSEALRRTGAGSTL